MNRISPTDEPTARKLADIAAEAGLRRIHVLAWRDLADVEAGGSEVYVANVARLWASAGLEVTMRSSQAQGHRAVAVRDGYRVIRRAGRYAVFPHAAWDELTARYGANDGLVEIWNGMPFFSPAWHRGPRVALVHHAHTAMWPLVLPPSWARVGDLIERRIAPRVYCRTGIVTVSPSSKRELVQTLGLRADRITVVPPGLADRFAPGGSRSPTPLALAVGRLVPVKRFDRAIRLAAAVRRRVPGFHLVIVGDGYVRPDLEQRVDELGAGEAVTLAGRVRDDELVELYRRAWVVVSTSAAEGWGMSITEAAACGTPAIATRITGHVDAVVDGHTGVLVDGERLDHMVDAVVALVNDDVRRARLGANALQRAAQFTWSHTAVELLHALADDAIRRRRPRS
ncbi:MAG: glycosyltransferase family 4 protein [Acidimicrobiales bacterium]